jgi:hypothetical protein
MDDLDPVLSTLEALWAKKIAASKPDPFGPIADEHRA